MSNWPDALSDKAKPTSNLLRVLSDDKSFAIFKTIAINTDRSGGRQGKTGKMNERGIDSRYIVSQTKLGRKAFNERLLCLIRTGLVTERKTEMQSNKTNKDHRYYTLTKQGQEVYDACLTIEYAINNRPKLRALESLLERYNLQDIATANDETKNKLINTLIDNHKVKDSLQDRVATH
jgi:hypothetical protein